MEAQSAMIKQIQNLKSKNFFLCFILLIPIFKMLENYLEMIFCCFKYGTVLAGVNQEYFKSLLKFS